MSMYRGVGDKAMKKELYILFISMLPFIELRGSIPVGIGIGMPFWEVWTLSVIGNMIPILPILLLFRPISEFLNKFQWYHKIYQWICQRTIKKGKDTLDKYGALGLFIFTAIPLPTTGAWTAAFLASFFRIKIKYAFPAITGGVVFAGFIVAIFSHLLFR